MRTKKWKPLVDGDVVEIIAPGMKPSSGVVPKIKPFLKSWNLHEKMANDLVGRDLISSNSKEYRVNSLKQALLAEDSQMVWCLRGGYGSFQLLESLKKIKPPKECKLFMGLSDPTSLHTFLVQEWGWSTIHGVNLQRLVTGQAKASEQSRFKSLIFGKTQDVNYKLKPLNDHATKKNKTQGLVVGGNMITLQANFGTQFQLNTRSKILFFEDIGERAYRIHRVFEHMEQLGLFKGVRAVVFGQFTGGREPSGQNLVPKLLKQFAREQSFPVFSGIKSGHGDNQHPLPFGTKAIITGGKNASIHIESGALSL